MSTLDDIVRSLKPAPWGTPEAELAAAIAAPKSEFHEAVDELVYRRIVVRVPPFLVHTTQFERRVQGTIQTAQSLLEDSKQAAIPIDRLWKATKCPWENQGHKELIGRLRRAGIDYERGRLFPANVRLKTRQRAMLDRVLERLLKTPYSPPGFKELAQDLNIPLHAASDILTVGEMVGELTRISADIVIPTESIQKLPDILAERLEPPFAPTDVTEALDSSRKFVIPILEYLDAHGVTRRLGNRRILVEATTEDDHEEPQQNSDA